MSRRFPNLTRTRGHAHWRAVEVFVWSGVAVMAIGLLGLLTSALMLAAASLRG
jgi:hypothetical protein